MKTTESAPVHAPLIPLTDDCQTGQDGLAGLRKNP